MTLNLSAAHSSRFKKKPQANTTLLKRSSSFPLTNLNRRKPVHRSKTRPQIADKEEDHYGDRLEDLGLVKKLAANSDLGDVAQTLQYVQAHMFDSLPESGGFNSTRIAEILNFRKSLPPTVTVTHIHTLTPSPTRAEREIAELIRAGILRKLAIPGRGTGGSGIGESLVLSEDIEKLLRASKDVDNSLADDFLKDLMENPHVQKFKSGPYPPAQISTLMGAGFLTSTSSFNGSLDLFNRPYSASAGTLTSIASISKAASGTPAAVGGEGAIYDVGGRGGIRQSSPHCETQHTSRAGAAAYQLSLPGIGPYLRLLTDARSHLVSLIRKSHYQEVPLYLLKERWEGSVSGDDPAARAKKYRGEFAGVLPARTRKWRQFYGLSLDWVLAESLGAGLIEVFETGTVGRAVRIP